MHAVVPVDTQHNDSYFVVAHFHYVLFGGSIFASWARSTSTGPKVFGKLLDERLGKIQFWLTFARLQPDLLPDALPRAGRACRAGISTYSFESGWWFWNVIATIGALLIAASVLVFLINVIAHLRRANRASAPTPGTRATLEWAIPSPPPVYNFRIIPLVTHRDQLWHEKYDRARGGCRAPGSVADAIVEVDQLAASTRRVGVAVAEAQAEEGISICRIRPTARSWRRSASSCWPSASWSTIRTSSSGSSGSRSSPRSGSWRWSLPSTAGRSSLPVSAESRSYRASRRRQGADSWRHAIEVRDRARRRRGHDSHGGP